MVGVWSVCLARIDVTHSAVCSVETHFEDFAEMSV